MNDLGLPHFYKYIIFYGVTLQELLRLLLPCILNFAQHNDSSNPLGVLSHQDQDDTLKCPIFISYKARHLVCSGLLFIFGSSICIAYYAPSHLALNTVNTSAMRKQVNIELIECIFLLIALEYLCFSSTVNKPKARTDMVFIMVCDTGN